ncbi:YfgM family protein [Gilvimarinus polysaccharolyticus]|uniref:YfgM family protein n=1 Tax=Gilvimarinus polysaccharolyticus TaxID=863921 RepID=UPI00067354BE|nr:tetratricopeptide repeat protein [Gilvimarinus polysaccharolyticus]
MSEHLTEEEQIENLKRLWKEYGSTIIVSVAVATSGYFGWNFWQDQQQAKAEMASDFYEQLVTAAGEGDLADEAHRATIGHLAQQIKDVDKNSAYAAQAALYAAQAALSANDLETAKGQLSWVIDTSDSPALQEIARLRLARVLAAEGNYDKALSLVANQPASGFAAEQAEVRGDILRQNGDSAAALTAYQSAIEKVGPEQQQRQLVLQMKIDNLKPANNSEEPSA